MPIDGYVYNINAIELFFRDGDSVLYGPYEVRDLDEPSPVTPEYTDVVLRGEIVTALRGTKTRGSGSFTVLERELHVSLPTVEEWVEENGLTAGLPGTNAMYPAAPCEPRLMDLVVRKIFCDGKISQRVHEGCQMALANVSIADDGATRVLSITRVWGNSTAPVSVGA